MIRVALTLAQVLLVGIASATVSRTIHTSAGEFVFTEDGTLTISADTEQLQTTLSIAEDGQLTRDDEPVPTDKTDRKLLREFTRETEKMADLLDEVSALVARQVDPDTDPDEQEQIGKELLKTGKDLEKQNQKLAKITGKLIDRNPELAVFGAIFAE